MADSPFDEVQFPTDISEYSDGGPAYQTVIITRRSGRESRATLTPNGMSAWNIASGVRSKAHIDTVITFFRARQGKYRGFRFQDPEDYAIVPTAGLTTQITTKIFQIHKQYVSGSTTADRTIYKPVSGTLTVYENDGTTVVDPGDYTADYTTGRITFTAAPGFVPRVECEFDVPVRFDTDRMSISAKDLERGYQLPVQEYIP